MSNSPESTLTSKALTMTYESQGKPSGAMFHSDQGCHYTSKKYRQLLWRYRITQSMSRRGNCWDKLESEHRITDAKDLKGAKGYVVKFTSNRTTVYAVKRSTSTWKTSYPKKYINMLFSNGELSGIEDNSFSIEKNFDFYVINNTVFIANKRGFESAMQHRTAYVQAFTQLQQTPAFSRLLSDINPIIEYVGKNSIQLRRMAVIEEKGIYNRPNFISTLQRVNTTRNWGINFHPTNNTIIPCESTVSTIINVLLDHRLMSEITDNIYDIPDATQV